MADVPREDGRGAAAAWNEIVGPDEKVFFLHLPKTAGVSLNAYIESRFRVRDIFPRYRTEELVGLPSSAFDEFLYFRGHISYGILRRYLGFDPATIVMLRDPVRRTLSHFTFLRENEDIPIHYDRDLFRQITVDEFFADVAMAARLTEPNVQTAYLVRDLDPTGLAHFGGGPDAQLLVNPDQAVVVAQRMLDRFRFVGITERFQESLLLLAYTFGWRPDLSLHKHNTTRSRSPRDVPSVETRRRIAELNSLDASLYEYAVSVFEQRYTAMLDDLIAAYGTQIPGGVYAEERDTLSLETVVRMVEWRYLEHFRRTRVPAESIRINFNQAVEARGWHARETDPSHGPFRWSGPDTTSDIDLMVVPGRDMHLTLRVRMVLDRDILSGLEASVNGTRLSLARHDQGDGSTTYTGLVPGALVAERDGFVRLTIELPWTSLALVVLPDSKDDRRLGIAVNLIELTPI